jgi:hypothetical protein
MVHTHTHSPFKRENVLGGDRSGREDTYACEHFDVAVDAPDSQSQLHSDFPGPLVPLLIDRTALTTHPRIRTEASFRG